MWPVVILAGVGLTYLVRECSAEAQEEDASAEAEEADEADAVLDRDFALQDWRTQKGVRVIILDAEGVEKLQGKVHSVDCTEGVIVLDVGFGRPQYKAWLLKPHESVVKC